MIGYYHRDMDGVASAYVYSKMSQQIVWNTVQCGEQPKMNPQIGWIILRYGEEPKINSQIVWNTIQYGEELNIEAEDKEVVFVDFTPTIEQIQKMINDGRVVRCIDHHGDKAKAIHEHFANYKNFMRALDPDAKGCCNLIGTMVDAVYNYQAVKCIGERDVWDFSAPETAPYHEWCLAFGPSISDYAAWFEVFEEENFNTCVDLGKQLLAKRDSIVANAVAGRKVMSIIKNNGVIFTLPAVNSTEYASEIGNELAKMSPQGIGLVYSITNNCLKLSFRSINGSAQNLASVLGGGGHPNAAGAVVESYTIDDRSITV